MILYTRTLITKYSHNFCFILTTFYVNSSYWSYIENLKTFVDGGMLDFTFVDKFSEMVVKSSIDAGLRRSTFKALLHILFSDVKLNQPSPVTISSYDIATASPSSDPIDSPYSNGFLSTNTWSPTETRTLSPQIILQPPESVQEQNIQDGIETSLPANTRVDLTNSAVGNVYPESVLYNTMFSLALFVILHLSF